MSPLPGPALPVADPRPQPAWRRDGPRFVLAAWVVAGVAMVLVSTLAAAAVAVVATVRAAAAGERSQARFAEIAEASIASPQATWVLLIASQLAVLACALLACRLLRKPAVERLGLGPTGLNAWQGLVIVVATAVPFALGLGAAALVERVAGPSGSDAMGLQRMWSEGSRATSAVWILVIALVPGFAEEVFFRGLVLRGLLQRWRPATSILVSAASFAVMHGQLAWAAFILPIGVWFGVVAWRTGSTRLTFVLHATINGGWTTLMMVQQRDPDSTSTLTAVAFTLLALGLAALPWAIAILRRGTDAAASPRVHEPQHFVPRVLAVAAAAGAVAFVIVPPGAERAPAAPATAAEPPVTSTAPSLARIESSVTGTATCPSLGDAGAAEIVLFPGAGTRVALPPNRAGIDAVTVMLDDEDHTVWLAYGGERSGKGVKGRTAGIVEQFVSGAPTVLCITLSDGPAPVSARVTIEDTVERKTELFARAWAEGWALRGRK